MKSIVPFLIIFTASTAGPGCRPSDVERMAHATKQIDQAVSAEYDAAADVCLNVSDNWPEYDDCMVDWEEARVAVRTLYQSTWALKTDMGRKAQKQSACQWYRSIIQVREALPVKVPALETAYTSRWKRKC